MSGYHKDVTLPRCSACGHELTMEIKVLHPSGGTVYKSHTGAIYCRCPGCGYNMKRQHHIEGRVFKCVRCSDYWRLP